MSYSVSSRVVGVVLVLVSLSACGGSEATPAATPLSSEETPSPTAMPHLATVQSSAMVVPTNTATRTPMRPSTPTPLATVGVTATLIVSPSPAATIAQTPLWTREFLAGS